MIEYVLDNLTISNEDKVFIIYNSNLNSYKKNFDSTLYSEILLLTLATSIIYYIFTKV